ncbi:hypothetical protein U0070_019859, partial [Myodes glareolus]
GGPLAGENVVGWLAGQILCRISHGWAGAIAFPGGAAPDLAAWWRGAARARSVGRAGGALGGSGVRSVAPPAGSCAAGLRLLSCAGSRRPPSFPVGGEQGANAGVRRLGAASREGSGDRWLRGRGTAQHVPRCGSLLLVLQRLGEKQQITEQRTAGPAKPVAAAVPLMSG